MPLSALFDERLEALAHEASYLNEYSLGESLSSEIYERTQFETPNNTAQETEPLLPLYHTRTENYESSRPPSTLAPYQSYVRLFANVFYKYFLTENIRLFILKHQWGLSVGMIILVILIGFLFKGNLIIMLYYLQWVYCLIVTLLFPNSMWAGVCGA